MNKFIQEQLDKLQGVDVEKKSDTEFTIRKSKKIEFSVNHYYLIELADYIIHPNSNFTLAANWNKGIVPKSKTLRVMVTQILGKMIKVDATSETGDDNYVGLWLPIGGVTIKGEL